MDAGRLIALHPLVFHMAPAEALPSIRARGLFTSEQLVELYEVDAAHRASILQARRTEPVILQRAGLAPVVIRDQKPMKFIEEKIEAGSSLAMYLEAINQRVFFWPTRERLTRLLVAKEYRAAPQVILHVDTAKLIARYGSRLELCRFNSGAVTQKNHPRRGHNSWVPIADYPYDAYRKRHRAQAALAEVTVRNGVPDVMELVRHIEHISGPRGKSEPNARAPRS